MNRYENTLGNKIIKQTLADRELNVSKLAKDIKVSHTNIWFYLNGLRKWNLESWLDTLAALGFVSAFENRIIINAKIDPSIVEHLTSLKSKKKTYFLGK